MSLIRNERLKLLANNLDRASTACLAVGIFAPLVGATTDMQSDVTGWTLIFSSGVWIFTAFALHMGGRHVLGGLEG